MYLMAIMLGCTPDIAPNLDEATLQSYPGPPTVDLDVPVTAVEGEPFEFDVHLESFRGPRTVRVFAAGALGRGPCDPRSGQCLDLVGPRTLVEQRTARDSDWTVSWTPPLPAGSRFWLQAVLFDSGGVARFVDDPWPVDVVPRVPGCTFVGSPDYDLQATLDDGSCQCPRELRAHSLADLNALNGCTGVELLTIDGAINGPIRLPGLQFATWTEITNATGVTALELPALAEGRLALDGVEGSFDVTLPAARTVDFIANASPGLRALRAPGAATLRSLDLTWNPNLSEVTIEGAGDLQTAGIGWNDALTTVELRNDLAYVVNVWGNNALRSIALTGTRGASTVTIESNPALESVDIAAARVGRVEVFENRAVRQIALPHATQARVVGVSSEPMLTTLSLPALLTTEDLMLLGTAATALDLPALTTVDNMLIYGNPDLTAVSVPSLSSGSVELSNNTLLCVTNEPRFANPPPGLRVTGQGNLCDPP
jgi:hypothetical protein